MILLFGFGLLCGGGPLLAVRDLVEQSPFLPPGFKQSVDKANKLPPKKLAPPKQSDLVFKGYYRLGGVWRFSILDKKTGKSRWVVKGEKTEDGLTITDFGEDFFLAYNYNGESGELELASPSSNPVPIQRGSSGTKPSSGKGRIPTRNTNPRPSATKPKATTRNIASTNHPKNTTPTVIVGGKTPVKATPASAPNAPPASPAPSFIPKLPAHLSSGLPSGLSNAMKDAEDRGQSTVKVDLGTPNFPNSPIVNPATDKPAPVATAPPATNTSVFTAPPINSPGAPPASPQSPQKIIPRRTPLNLPPGIPPPPTTAPPSLPDFLNVGGPPSPPPTGKP